MRWYLLACLGLGLALASPPGGGAADAVSSPRAALVIGNAAYPDGDDVLKTPVGDADMIAKTLAQKNFAIESVKNGTRKQMDAAIARFLDGIGQNTDVAIFYAGYGIQVARRNYLIPVDARIWSEADVLRDGIAIDAVLADAARKGANARVVMLDASRRNPFERRFRSLSAGLAAATPRPGVLILSSAAAGAVLADADGPTSLFATELRKQIDASALAAENAFEACRDAVSRASQGQQMPVVVSGLETPFYFDAARKPPPAKVATGTSPALSASLEPQMPSATVIPTPGKAETPKPEAKSDPKSTAAKPEIAIAAPLPNPIKPPPAEQSLVDPLPLRPLPGETKAAAADAKLARIESTPPPATSPPAISPPATSPPVAPPPAASPPAISPPAQTALKPPDPEPPAGNAREQPARTSPAPEQAARQAALTAMIARNPRDVEALAERGRMLAQRGDLVAAVGDLDRVLKVDPRNVEALNNRCWARAVRNDLQMALADCNEALRLRHDYADAYDSRGMIFLKTGQPRAALADYEAAIKIDPSHSSAIYGRGLAHYRLGDKTLAARDFTSALGLNGTIDREYAQYGVQ